MHIVQLANFYGETSGGLRTVLDELGRSYAAACHRVTRIVPSAEDSVADVSGVRVVSLRSPRLLATGYRAILDVSRVDGLLEDLRPDVIELSDKTTLVGSARRCRERGASVVLISHERIDAILADRVPAWFPLARCADRWNRKLAASVDAIVCASEFSASEFRGIDAHHVHRIPLGVDLEVFTPSRRQRDPTGIPSRATATVVCVGRLSAEKQPRTAIDAMRRLAERGAKVRLVMIGDGPERRRLERSAAGLDVMFAGHVRGRAQLAAILREADVALAPCPAETFGLGALEALASGTPIVVPRSGALAELVVAGAGVVVENESSAFASAIEHLLAGSRTAHRTAARHRAEEFDWATTTSAMLELFEGVTGVDRREAMRSAC
jgi:alpha-1,6-mannosyltransferase